MSAIKICANTKLALAATAVNIEKNLVGDSATADESYRTLQTEIDGGFSVEAPQWELGGSYIVYGNGASPLDDASGTGAANALDGLSGLDTTSNMAMDNLYLKANVLQGELRAAFQEELNDQFECAFAPQCNVGHKIPGLYSNIDSVIGARHKVAIPGAGDLLVGVFDDNDDVNAPEDSDSTGLLGSANHRAFIAEYCHNLGAGVCGKQFGDVKLAVRGVIHQNQATTAASGNSRTENASAAVNAYFARNRQSSDRTDHNEKENVYELGANLCIGDVCDKNGQLLLGINSTAKGNVLNYSASYERTLNLIRGCAPKDCNDIIGVKVIRPDHVNSVKNSSGSAEDAWAAVKDTEKPLALQLTYCTRILGMNIPIYALRMADVLGKDSDDSTNHDNDDAWFFGIGANAEMCHCLNGELKGCPCPEGGEDEDEDEE
jgi:hypothetical protein